MGRGGSVTDLHNAFVRSPSHYENLVEPSYDYVGIGVAYDSNGTIFVVFDFMALQSPVPETSATSFCVGRSSTDPGLRVVVW